jgi:hypothetical protein
MEDGGDDIRGCIEADARWEIMLLKLFNQSHFCSLFHPNLWKVLVFAAVIETITLESNSELGLIEEYCSIITQLNQIVFFVQLEESIAYRLLPSSRICRAPKGVK